MSSLLPERFLFRYDFAVQHVPAIPKKTKKLLGLPKSCEMPPLQDIDGSASFGTIKLGWNNKGLGLSLSVKGKKHPVIGKPEQPLESDGLQVWIDTRNTQNIHRASRFCHHFCLLPAATGKNHDQPYGLEMPIARAREESSIAKPNQIKLSSSLQKEGYELEVWLSEEILTGFDTESNPHLGFYFFIHDNELGDQHLTVGEDFPFANDPSLWSTLSLKK